MTLAYWCVLIAILLPYLATALAKFGGAGFDVVQDNRNPRAFLERLDGWRRRAHFAQLNGFEVTPAFGIAVIIAHMAGGAAQSTIDLLAVLFVVCRVLYLMCYLADWASLRTVVWGAGLAIIVALFCVSA